MVTHWLGDIMYGDVSEVVDKPVFDSKFGLSNILYTTYGAADGVDQVGCLAIYLCQCPKFPASRGGLNAATFIEFRAESAF